jgi:hypothetical protein
MPRWEKDGKYIQVCSGLKYGTKLHYSASWVESDAFDGGLPVEWRGAMVPHSDTELAGLIARIRQYSEANDFKPAKSTC